MSNEIQYLQLHNNNTSDNNNNNHTGNDNGNHVLTYFARKNQIQENTIPLFSTTLFKHSYTQITTIQLNNKFAPNLPNESQRIIVKKRFPYFTIPSREKKQNKDIKQTKNKNNKQINC